MMVQPSKIDLCFAFIIIHLKPESFPSFSPNFLKYFTLKVTSSRSLTTSSSSRFNKENEKLYRNFEDFVNDNKISGLEEIKLKVKHYVNNEILNYGRMSRVFLY